MPIFRPAARLIIRPPAPTPCTYQVADAAGNQATVTRTVIVVAGSAPVITLLGDNPMTLQAGETFADPGATANDTFGW